MVVSGMCITYTRRRAKNPPVEERANAPAANGASIVQIKVVKGVEAAYKFIDQEARRRSGRVRGRILLCCSVAWAMDGLVLYGVPCQHEQLPAKTWARGFATRVEAHAMTSKVPTLRYYTLHPGMTWHATPLLMRAEDLLM